MFGKLLKTVAISNAVDLTAKQNRYQQQALNYLPSMPLSLTKNTQARHFFRKNRLEYQDSLLGNSYGEKDLYDLKQGTVDTYDVKKDSKNYLAFISFILAEETTLTKYQVQTWKDFFSQIVGFINPISLLFGILVGSFQSFNSIFDLYEAFHVRLEGAKEPGEDGDGDGKVTVSLTKDLKITHPHNQDDPDQIHLADVGLCRRLKMHLTFMCCKRKRKKKRRTKKNSSYSSKLALKYSKAEKLV